MISSSAASETWHHFGRTAKFGHAVPHRRTFSKALRRS